MCQPLLDLHMQLVLGMARTAILTISDPKAALRAMSRLLIKEVTALAGYMCPHSSTSVQTVMGYNKLTAVATQQCRKQAAGLLLRTMFASTCSSNCIRLHRYAVVFLGGNWPISSTIAGSKGGGDVTSSTACTLPAHTVWGCRQAQFVKHADTANISRSWLPAGIDLL